MGTHNLIYRRKMNLSILVTTAFVAAAETCGGSTISCGTASVACDTSKAADVEVWADGCKGQTATPGMFCLGTTLDSNKPTNASCDNAELTADKSATNCSELTAALMFKVAIPASGYPLDQKVVNDLCAAFTNKDEPQDACKAIDDVVSQMYTEDSTIMLCVVDEGSGSCGSR